jgi:transposase-like protein
LAIILALVAGDGGHVSDTELLHKTKPGPVQRLEVFSGTGRRRAWTVEQKAQIVAESYASGETVSAVARRYGLTPQQLFSWRRRAGSKIEDRGPAFAPVIFEECCAAKGTPATRAVPGVIEIVIGMATVRVAPGTDVASLRAVLRAVMAMS